MRKKAFCWLRLLVGLLLVAGGAAPSGGLGVVLRHIEIAGPRQWLNLVAGSLVSNTPVVTPVTARLARALPARLVTSFGDKTSDIA
ncbi:MAG: hypothetical protein E6G96_15870 [Alphaproteobacteria bacterium]|nr:MAG: hypothetical protein E6G96_15870 [Alphaproteobacteria bacterium]